VKYSIFSPSGKTSALQFCAIQVKEFLAKILISFSGVVLNTKMILVLKEAAFFDLR